MKCYSGRRDDSSLCKIYFSTYFLELFSQCPFIQLPCSEYHDINKYSNTLLVTLSSFKLYQDSKLLRLLERRSQSFNLKILILQCGIRSRIFPSQPGFQMVPLVLLSSGLILFFLCLLFLYPTLLTLHLVFFFPAQFKTFEWIRV